MKRGYVKMLSLILCSALGFSSCTQPSDITAESGSPDLTQSITFMQETGWGETIKSAGTIDENSSYSLNMGDNLKLQIAYEGTVLLKNNSNALPLTVNDTVAVFGSSQLWKATYARYGYRLAGAGSGALYDDPKTSPINELRKKSNDGKFKLYNDISLLYENAYNDPKYAKAKDNALFFPDDNAIKKAKDAGVNKVIYILSRLEGEAGTEESLLEPYSDTAPEPEPDNAPVKGEYYLSELEEQQLKILSENFKQVIVVTNTGNIIDTSWARYGIDYGNGYQKVADAALFAWYGGLSASQSLADILVGDANPSGKLVQTAARDFMDYPAARDYYNESFQEYTEDIFVGYRYFETFDPQYKRVNYEFGFGLSYTQFEISDPSFTYDDNYVTVTATVKNTGNRNGKEVVQVYFSAPQKDTNNAKLSKPGKELATFIKTKELAPNESQTVTLKFPIKDMSSFDDLGVTGAKSAYVLEAGDYKIFLGNSIKNVVELGSYTVNQFTVVEQLTSLMAPYDLHSRYDYKKQIELLMPKIKEKRTLNKFDKSVLNGTKINEFYHPGDEPKVYDKIITYDDVKSGNNTLDELVSQMSISELASLTVAHYREQSSAKSGLGASEEMQEKYKIPLGTNADGPSGLGPFKHILGIPSGITLASSWNLDLAADFGTLTGILCEEDGYYPFWLAPGMNITRSPIGGRNFEYFSEDPLITGLFGSAITEKFQKYGAGICLKHFAANNRELNRQNSDSRVSERALREIYLRGFEIAVKETDPISIMTSYNLVNGYEACESPELLLGIAREEWGFDGVFMTDWNKTPSLTYMILGGNNTNMGDPNEMWESDVLLEDYVAKNISRKLLEENAKYIISALMRLKIKVEDANLVFAGWRYALSDTEVTNVEAEQYFCVQKNVRIESNHKASGNSCLGYFDYNSENPNEQVFTSYKFELEKDCTFELDITLSSVSGSKVEVYLDDKLLNTNTNVPATGSYQNFTTMNIGKIKFTKGTHVLKLVVKDKGFKPDLLSFTPQ